jgi:ribosomal protein L11 methylase PrmA
MSKRFNSLEYLEDYQKFGRWPQIHNQMFNLIMAESRSERFIDLGCSTGLLGERVMLKMRSRVVGIDCDLEAIEAALKANVIIDFVRMEINQDTLESLKAIITTQNITCVIARRILPEIVNNNKWFGYELAKAFAESGIKEIFLEGRIYKKDSVNILASIEDEVEILKPFYFQTKRHGNLARLKLNSNFIY